MSKFIDQITMEILRNRKMEHKPLSVFTKTKTSIEETYVEFNILTQYRVGVEFTQRFYAKDSMEAKHLKARFVESVKEAVYGDLRLLLWELEGAVYNQDRSKCQEIMDKVHKEIT